jgi:hypothetical protein
MRTPYARWKKNGETFYALLHRPTDLAQGGNSGFFAGDWNRFDAERLNGITKDAVATTYR